MVASGLAFGSLTVLSKLAFAEGIAIATLLLLRFGIATLVLAPYVIRAAPERRHLLLAVGLGFAGYGTTTIFYFHALVTLPAGVASFLLYLAPLPVVLVARVAFRERLPAIAVAGLVLGFAGLAALTLGPDVALDPRGVLLALGAALAYAGTILAGRKLVTEASPWTVAAGVCAGAFLAWLAWGAAMGDISPPPTGAAWGYALAIAVLCTAVAVAFFYLGLRLVGAARASVISIVEPAASVLLAAWILAETLTLLQAAGCGLILVGVVLATRGE